MICDGLKKSDARQAWDTVSSHAIVEIVGFGCPRIAAFPVMGVSRRCLVDCR